MHLKITKNGVRWLLAMIAIVLTIAFVLGVIYRTEVIGTVAGFDIDWMTGKTLGEIVERYGMFDGWRFDGSGTMAFVECVYHIFGESLWLSVKSDEDLSDPESVVTAVELTVSGTSSVYTPYDWSGYGDFFCGKTLEEVVSCLGDPVGYNEKRSAVAYENRSWAWEIVVFSLDGSYDSPDSVVVEFEPVETLETESGWVLLSEDVIL